MKQHLPSAASAWKLKAAIDKITRPVYKKRGFSQADIILRWPHIVGKQIAAFSAPQKLTHPKNSKDSAILHIAVHPAFALDMQQMQPAILEQIAIFYGYKAVHALRLHQTPHLHPQTVAIPPKKPSQTQEKHAQDVTSTVEDEKLREALRKLGANIPSSK